MNQPVLMNRILPLLAYPGVISLGLILHTLLLNMELNLQISTYIPIFLGVALISLLELVIPYRKAWKPKFSEVKTDVMFTLFVQILLPKALTFLAAILLLETVQATPYTLSNIWVHSWPLYAQVLLMMVSAEFFRYWLHRTSHHWSPLWRLHAVHHSPQKLYWVNTSRFHPFEKSLQFLFDALPFIILGVSQEVLAAYFVFYALNGFFQHSNINLKMGFLNYIISSAQLHRWHHSKDIIESDNNYGNNLIIWDIVFGTYYLPKHRSVGGLGLINREYPMSLMKQMLTPFTPGIDKYTTSLISLRDLIRNTQIQVGILLAKLFIKLPFEKSLNKPMKHQLKLLMNIVNENSQTVYGKQHHFGAITTYQDFIINVQIQDYEDLRDYIEKQEQTKQPYLTQEQPEYYAVTSGTTGRPKYIPVTSKTIKYHHRALAIFACVQAGFKKHAFGGKLLAIPGAYNEGKLKGGSTYGSISGLLYFLMPRYLREKYVIPNEVFSLTDHEIKYRLIIRLAIQHDDISYMVTANPSTFLKLMDIINQEIDTFSNDLESGTFNQYDDLPETISSIVEGKLLTNPTRANTLRSLKQLNRPLTYEDIWPNLKLIVTWTGGSCGIAISRLKTIIATNTDILELGYLASELRGSITLVNTGNAGAITFHDNFYEFIEVSKYENGLRETITLDQLKKDKLYFIIITSPAGLFRYFMNDIIEVTKYKKNTPIIRFVQKGKGVTNITGEKLSENQLMQAVEITNIEMSIIMPFYIALTSLENNCYDLYVEADESIDIDTYSSLLDEQLHTLNTEYCSKQLSGRLKKISIKLLKAGTGNAYKNFNLEKGMRESQFKYLLLQHESECDFIFNEHLV